MVFRQFARSLCAGVVGLLLVFQATAIAQTTQEEAAPVETAPASGPVQEGVDEWTDDAYKIEYSEIESNERFILYADMSNGLFALQERESGAIWYSTPNNSQLDDRSKGMERMTFRSQLLIHYVYSADIVTAETFQQANSQAACVNNGTVSVSKIDGGIRVVYDFAEYGIVIPVEYTLEEEYLNARILLNEIEQGDECILTGITLLPSFGAGDWDDEGYLFVPDGSGALIHFNNNTQTTTYDCPVYGEDSAEEKEMLESRTEAVRMPVFGAVSGNQALTGIITEGEALASIVAMNGTETRGYNIVASRVGLRTLGRMEMFEANYANRRQLSQLSEELQNLPSYTVRYYPSVGDAANYTGMAQIYRQYLVEEKGLTAKDTTPAFNVDLIGAIRTQAYFLGIPYTKMQALTTYEQAAAIVDALREQGIGNLSMRYLGWSNSGLQNKKIPTNAKALSVLGGKSAWEQLLDTVREEEVQLYPDTDLLSFEKGSKKRAVKTIFNKPAYQYQYMRSVYATRLDAEPTLLLSADYIAQTAVDYEESYRDWGFPSISLAAYGLQSYSDFHYRNIKSRQETADAIEEAVRTFSEQGYRIALEGANASVLPYADRIYSAPVSSSGYKIFDEEIPFYQIVLHGWVPMTAAPQKQAGNPEENFLKAVESGSEMLWTAMYADAVEVTNTAFDGLYSSTYTLWLEEAADLYGQWYPILEKVAGSEIVSHRERMPDVMETGYACGITVLVNYTYEDVLVDGRTIPARGFAAIEGETQP